jgi:hypothetical protein
MVYYVNIKQFTAYVCEQDQTYANLKAGLSHILCVCVRACVRACVWSQLFILMLWCLGINVIIQLQKVYIQFLDDIVSYVVPYRENWP